MTSALVKRCIHSTWHIGVEVYFVATCVIGYMKIAGPCFAAIFGEVEAAFAAFFPNGTIDSHPNAVGIGGIDFDHADVLGEFEAHVFEGFSAIETAINAVSVAHTALVVVFTGSHPKDVGVFGIQGEAADALRAVTIKDGLVGGSSIGGFPDATVSRSEVIFRFVEGVHRDVNDSTAGGRRTDHPEIHLTQNRLD